MNVYRHKQSGHLYYVYRVKPMHVLGYHLEAIPVYQSQGHGLSSNAWRLRDRCKLDDFVLAYTV